MQKQYEPIVEVDTGAVRGRRHSGVAVFKGIRYGVGRRFQRAEAPTSWTGVLDAVDYGQTSPQPRLSTDADPRYPLAVGSADIAGDAPHGEDCLVLNVWAPAEPASPLPVIVYFHAGGYHLGSASARRYDGTRLALIGDVIVISVNHRLGPLGYLFLGDSDDERFEASGNAGTLDLLLALRWVRRNVAAFGGDAGNVTLLGMSGGSSKITSLMALPDAAGLFHRAICHSGADTRLLDADAAAGWTRRLLTELDIPPSRIDRLLDVDAGTLVAAASRLGAGSNVFSPVLDQVVYHEHPLESIAGGTARDIRLIIGTAAQESSYLLPYDPEARQISHAGRFGRIDRLLGAGSEAILDVYRRQRPDASETELFVAASTDFIRVPSIRIAEAKVAGGGEPTFMFRVELQHPFGNGVYGAPHGIESPLMFDNTHTDPLLADDADTVALGRVLPETWSAFARTGKPQWADSTPSWPPYSLDRRATMRIGRQWHVEDDPDGAERVAWDQVDLAGGGLLSRVGSRLAMPTFPNPADD